MDWGDGPLEGKRSSDMERASAKGGEGTGIHKHLHSAAIAAVNGDGSKSIDLCCPTGTQVSSASIKCHGALSIVDLCQRKPPMEAR